MKTLRVVGFGMGPHHLTWEAAEALTEADYVLAVRKSDDDALLEVRRRICGEFGLELIEITDPERDRNDPSDYPGAVRDWHRARVAAFAEEIEIQDGIGIFLVWGDPSLYDSTLRIIEGLAASIDLTWEVIPGISAPQILAARHRIVLHEVGQPVQITTARRLGSALAAGAQNLVVMLGSAQALEHLATPELAEWQIWWGANLGAVGERLVAGTVAAALPEIREAHAKAKQEAGWVMDAYLLRAPVATR
ncbi:precorrin-6A synthase (deacetylating) [Nocardioides sp. Bht2]|uniref:precorrin-6A synthase (deacetylating) n=1 Tax=Nocardioides sp. Bht2 TaxID=3392297 RepID=UPI0039B641C1